MNLPSKPIGRDGRFFLLHIVYGFGLNVEEVVAAGVHEAVETAVAPRCRLVIYGHVFSGVVADIRPDPFLPCLDPRNACIHMEKVS